MSRYQLAVQGIYVAATALSLVLAVVLWRNREKTGALALCVGGLSGSLWALGLFVSTLPWDAVAREAIRVMYIGVGTATASTLVFALEYTGRERYVTRQTLAAIAVHPVLLVVFVFLNPADLFFTDLDPNTLLGVEQTWGPAFWLHSAYSYALIGAVTVMLAELLLESDRPLYRGQAVSLALGLLSPLFFNGVFLAGLVEFDSTPIGTIGMVAFFTVGIVRYDFTKISPIARKKVIDNVRDGMLVVDTDRTVIETNPAAERMLGFEVSPVGKTMSELLSDLPELQSDFEAMTAAKDKSQRTITYGDRYLDIVLTPISDDRERHVGWLLLIQDVTERIQRERDLEEQIDKLDQFASLVSHDLRNPINVAKGFVQQTQATGNLEHLEKSEEAIERMEAIIDDVLALAREGEDVTEPQETSLAAVARRAWGNVDTAGASLVVTDAAETTILADGSRLTRLFENLFRNSVEHGVEGTGEEALAAGHTVTVDADQVDSRELVFSVADDGVGIPPENHNQVFENGYTTNEEGTGLGLAIVEQIAGAHGWDVAVAESESGGARFEITGVDRPIPA